MATSGSTGYSPAQIRRACGFDSVSSATSDVLTLGFAVAPGVAADSAAPARRC